MKYGTAEPCPYDVTLNGETITLGVIYFGSAAIFISDDAKAESFGGLTGLEETLRKELVNALNKDLQSLSQNGVTYTELPMHSLELSNSLTAELNEKWSGEYGVGVNSIGIDSIRISDEDQALLQKMEEEAIAQQE